VRKPERAEPQGEPRLTALLPVKAFHRSYLEQAVASVLAQTSPHWRLLVIAEPEVLADVAQVLDPMLDDGRVRLIASEGRRLAGALNTGICAADTAFVAIILGDDLWAPEAVAVLSSHIERFPDIDFFHSGRLFVDEHDRPLGPPHPPRDSFALDDFARGSPVKHLLCWRRDTALAIGGMDETLESVGPDDYDFPWSMAEAGARFMAIPACLYRYRDHRASFRLTTHLPRRVHVRALRRILRKHGVGRLRTEWRIMAARRTYLRQCLYRSRLDRWLKARVGFDLRRGWREPYG
jgi:O-antigen biosynthesis protein